MEAGRMLAIEKEKRKAGMMGLEMCKASAGQAGRKEIGWRGIMEGWYGKKGGGRCGRLAGGVGGRGYDAL